MDDKRSARRGQPKKIRELSIDDMLELRKRGVTLHEIGRRLGISRQRVHQILGNTKHLKPGTPDAP